MSIYDSMITKNDNLLDDTNIMFIFEVLFFVTLKKIIGNKFNNSLVICAEKKYRMTAKPKTILFLWSQLLFLACIELYGLAIKRKNSHT